MAITKDDVKYIANLSKISINDAEADSLTTELSAILDYFKQLEGVDVNGLEPTYQVTGLVNIMRKDQIDDYGVNREQLLQNAPQSQDGQIKVPKVL